MTSHVARLYALAAAVVLFFVLWAGIAAHPWSTQSSAPPDPRVAALAAREQRLRHDAVVVRRIVRARFAAYRVHLHRRQAAISAAKRAQAAAAAAAATPVATPSVRVVTLPPLTVTRTS
jgi:hypothetical protein